MFCTKCGKQLKDDSSFCTSCGYKVIPVINVVNSNDNVAFEGNEVLINEKSNIDYEFKFTGKMTLDDFSLFSSIVFLKQVFSKKTIIFWSIIAFLSFIISLFQIYSVGRIEDGLFGGLIVIIFIPLLWLTISKSKSISKLIYKKTFFSNKMNQEEQAFYLKNNNLSIKTESQEINLTKKEIKNILFDNESIYIMISISQGFIIKDRYCKDFNEFNNIKKCLINDNYHYEVLNKNKFKKLLFFLIPILLSVLIGNNILLEKSSNGINGSWFSEEGSKMVFRNGNYEYINILKPKMKGTYVTLDNRLVITPMYLFIDRSWYSKNELMRLRYVPDQFVDRQVAMHPQFQINGMFSAEIYQQTPENERVSIWFQTRDLIANEFYTYFEDDIQNMINNYFLSQTLIYNIYENTHVLNVAHEEYMVQYIGEKMFFKK